jgi:(2Fe-2S) ferredoxin
MDLVSLTAFAQRFFMSRLVTRRINGAREYHACARARLRHDPLRIIARVRIRRHVFVCTNQRPPGGRPACGARGADAVLAALQEAVLADPALCGLVAITPCGCLGPCFDGPNLVVYPEGIWYAGVTLADVAELVEKHLRAGEVVQRLVYDHPDD